MSKKYPGILNEPIHSKKSLLQNDSEYEIFVLQEKMLKLNKLFEYYNIDNTKGNNYFNLSLRLAEDNIRGFQIEKNRAGAPSKWKDFDGIDFYLMVELVREKKGYDVRKSIDIIREKYGFEKSTDSLRTRYYEIQKGDLLKNITQILELLKKENRSEDSIAEIYNDFFRKEMRISFEKLK